MTAASGQQVTLRFDPAQVAPTLNASGLEELTWADFTRAAAEFGLDAAEDREDFDELFRAMTARYAELNHCSMAVTDLALRLICGLLASPHLGLTVAPDGDRGDVARAVGALTGEVVRRLMYSIALSEWMPCDHTYADGDPAARSYTLQFTEPTPSSSV